MFSVLSFCPESELRIWQLAEMMQKSLQKLTQKARIHRVDRLPICQCENEIE